jgi:hypothetical protein
MKIASLCGQCMEPVCVAGSHTNNLPTPTNLTNNPYREEKKHFLFWGELKIGHDGCRWNCFYSSTVELQPPWPIFDKCSHLRDTKFS